MGSASSKAGRRLPKRVATPWAGARTPDGHTPLARLRASEVKNEAIERDSGDPDFLTKLNRLGSVRVDHHMQSVRPASADHMNRIFGSEGDGASAAQQTETTRRNRVEASSLIDLLEERKSLLSSSSAAAREELGRSAGMHGMDLSKLESVARYVNSPSVGEGTIVKHIDENGDETITMRAVWVDIEPPTTPKPPIARGQSV